IKQLKTHGALDAVEAEAAGGLLRRPIEQQPAWVQSLSARTPSVRDLGILIQQAGSSMRVRSLLLLCFGMGFLPGTRVLILLRFSVFAGIEAAFGCYRPIWCLKRRRKARTDAIEAGLPEAIDLLGRAIRAGHPLSGGLKMVADETQEPIAGEFQRTFEE